MEILEYNTQRSPLAMPEYGRNVLKMIEKMKSIEDRDKRTQQARAIIKVMETLNPSVHSQEDFAHKLWDHLYIIAGFNLDVDAPYPSPVAEDFQTRPIQIPMKDSKIKATHYGRNIEKIINLLCEEPDGEIKTEMIRSLAIYMRQQYLIWNKDSVADETIFNDIEKISDHRLTVPEGLRLHQIAPDASFSRPGMGAGVGQAAGPARGKWRKGNKNKKNRA